MHHPLFSLYLSLSIVLSSSSFSPPLPSIPGQNLNIFQFIYSKGKRKEFSHSFYLRVYVNAHLSLCCVNDRLLLTSLSLPPPPYHHSFLSQRSLSSPLSLALSLFLIYILLLFLISLKYKYLSTYYVLLTTYLFLSSLSPSLPHTFTLFRYLFYSSHSLPLV